MILRRYPYLVHDAAGMAWIGDTSACCRATAKRRAQAEVQQRELGLPRVDVARLWLVMGSDYHPDFVPDLFVQVGRGQFERHA